MTLKHVVFCILIVFVYSSPYWVGTWKMLDRKTTDEILCPVPADSHEVRIFEEDELVVVTNNDDVEYKLLWDAKSKPNQCCIDGWCYRGEVIERVNQSSIAKVLRYEQNPTITNHSCWFTLKRASKHVTGSDYHSDRSEYSEGVYQRAYSYSPTWLGKWTILESFSVNHWRCPVPQVDGPELEFNYDGRYMRFSDESRMNYALKWRPYWSQQYFQRGKWSYEGSIRTENQSVFAFIYFMGEESDNEHIYCFWRMSKPVPEEYLEFLESSSSVYEYSELPEVVIRNMIDDQSYHWIGMWKILNSTSLNDSMCTMPPDESYADIYLKSDGYMKFDSVNQVFELDWNFTDKSGNYTTKWWIYSGRIWDVDGEIYGQVVIRQKKQDHDYCGWTMKLTIPKNMQHYGLLRTSSFETETVEELEEEEIITADPQIDKDPTLKQKLTKPSQSKNASKTVFDV